MLHDHYGVVITQLPFGYDKQVPLHDLLLLSPKGTP